MKPEKGSNWVGQKHPDTVPASYNRFKGVKHLLAAYDLSKDKMYAHMKKRKTHVEFLVFLKYLRSLHPISILIQIILDNFSPHAVPNVLEYAKVSNMELVFTPTNASWLNPIEPHFGPLRKFAISNSNPESHEEIGSNVRRYIAWRNRHHPAPREAQTKRVKHERTRLCGKCGMDDWEWH